MTDSRTPPAGFITIVTVREGEEVDAYVRLEAIEAIITPTDRGETTVCIVLRNGERIASPEQVTSILSQMRPRGGSINVSRQ